MLQYLVLARVGAFLAMYVFVQLSFINSRKPRVKHGDFSGPRVFMKQTLSGGGVGERTYVAYNSSV